MTLQDASTAALEAAQSGDLEALQVALEARCSALSTGELITPGALSAGELTAELLRDLIRNTRLESARLQKVADGFGASPSPASHVDLVG